MRGAVLGVIQVILWTAGVASADKSGSKIIAVPQVVPQKEEASCTPSQIVLVNTVDGGIHALHRETGQKLWSLADDWGPLVDVKNGQEDSENESNQLITSDGMYIPEPGGNGDLYYYYPGQPIKKLPLSLKNIVDENPAYVSNGLIHTAKKTSRLVALDSLTGKILRVFGDSDQDSDLNENYVDNWHSDPNVIFLARTQYILSIHDMKTSKIRWNISYGEFSVPMKFGTIREVYDESPLITMDSDNTLGYQEGKGISWTQQLPYQPVQIFQIKSVDNFQHPFRLFKVYPVAPSSTSPNDKPQETLIGQKNVVVGKIKGSYYVLSPQTFPQRIDHKPVAGAIAGDPQDLSGSYPMEEAAPSSQLIVFDWLFVVGGLISGLVVAGGVFYFARRRSIPEASKEEKKVIAKGNEGSQLKGEDKNQKQITEDNQSAEKENQHTEKNQTAAAETNGFGTPRRRRKKNKNSKTEKIEDEKAEQPIEIVASKTMRLHALEVSDQILGLGSHGTVVYKGRFEGREVAVKRLLLDFYDVAHHEVEALQDSDHHPNVVRYFYKEKTDKFMFIALELCPASLHDVIEKPQELQWLRSLLDPKIVLNQIMQGIYFLHTMKIVHRDIKPQNILIAETKTKGAHPRVLISDFGLCKRLAEDHSSFHNTIGNLGGTVGWRAPECMGTTAVVPRNESSSEQSSQSINAMGADAAKLSKRIDIFSAGCVFYYVLSGGSHPFGDRFMREINILKGNHRLDRLDAFGDDGLIAKDLIRRMISRDAKKRPDAKTVLLHPFFWSTNKRLAFLCDVSDRWEGEPRDPPTSLHKQLERNAEKIIGTDWTLNLDQIFIDDLSKYRKYDKDMIRDLLRAMRNKVLAHLIIEKPLPRPESGS